MKQFIAVIIVFLCLLLQSVVTTLPLILSILLVLYILVNEPWVVVMAFVVGIFQDSASVMMLGSHSLFLVLFLFVAMLYERKFETRTLQFIFLFSCLGSVFYGWFFGNVTFFQSVLNGVFASSLYIVFYRIGTLRLRHAEVL